MKIICICKKEFNVPPSRAKAGKGKYCSKPCYFSNQETYFKKGHTLNKGRKHTIQARINMGIAHRDESNGNWKGEAVKYRGLHMWVILRLGKARKCSNDINHKSSLFHWANISGEYRRDVSDWRELCPSCNHTDGIKIADRLRERRVPQFRPL